MLIVALILITRNSGGGECVKAFFVGCVIFLLIAWIFLSTEHGEEIGNSILDTIKDFFGSNDDCGGDDDE